ncbi:hypothetical protein L0Y65_00350 [Candidatus Micrarchaeota archaeon]|nr:hypothetical protein [Candidatus Micrarchaeota archaeon]
MVHCLEVLKKLNAETKKTDNTPKPYVPEKIGLNPALARKYVNRPWTKEELGGKESVFETYARGEREPFANAEVQGEGLQTVVKSSKPAQSHDVSTRTV